MKKQVRAHNLRVTTREYDIPTPSERVLHIAKGALIIPLRATDNAIWSLQFITATGQKWYLPGGEKNGHFHLIGEKPRATGDLLIVEGYATGASCLNASATKTVVCALDAGNLESVAKAIRDTHPDVCIRIGADNDQWTNLPDGTNNPGLTMAQRAADSVGGTVAAPTFTDEQITAFAEKNDGAKPTDWNDLHNLTNLAEVARQVTEQNAESDVRLLLTPPKDGESTNDGEEDSGGGGGIGNNHYFTPLGHNHGTYFFMTSRGKQIVAVAASKLTKPNLFQLAPLHYWEREFPRTEGFSGKAVDQAINALIGQCLSRGVFQLERMRGRGAWWDEDRLVFHAGDRLILDGTEEVALQEHRTHYVYEALPRIKTGLSTEMSTAQAHELHTLCTLLNWENKSFGSFFAGWLVIAPVCGALTWRPHIWLTGGSGSGKSWVSQKVVMRVLGDIALSAQGETTAAGICQALGQDARPVVFDEAEGEYQRAAENLQSILALVRASSSDDSGNILKGGKDGAGISYATKSAFCFGAIVPQIPQTADKNRIIVLALRESSRTEADRRKFSEQIEPLSKRILTEEFALGLRARTLRHFSTLQKNIAVFASVLADKLGSQRMADQYAPLAAGDYLLHTTKLVSKDEARAWIARQNWDEPQEIANTRDELKLLAQIVESPIEVDFDSGPSSRRTVAELVAAVAGIDANLTERTAAAALARKGLKVASAKLWVSNTHIGLRAMLRGTPWCDGWSRILGRIEGVEKDKAMRFGVIQSKATGIPIDLVVSRTDPMET